MKKFAMVFFQLSLILVLISCAPATRPVWVDKDTVSFAWDPVTPAEEDRAIIGYSVYICDPPSKGKDAKAVKLEDCEDDNDEAVNKNARIACIKEFAETGCIIRFNTSGTYVIGVQSVGMINNEEKVSAIAWSDTRIYTNNNPFIVRVPER
jgi:hypothetical protein